MILDIRQAHFGAVEVPEIKRWEEIKFSPYWLSIKNSLTTALIKRYREEFYKKMIEDCVSQSINFLMVLGAINEKEVNIKQEIINALEGKELELWKDWIPLSPIYEGINIQLKTMLIKHHFPRMYEQINTGQVYSHYGLTTIKECVLYTLEYLQKEDLLKDEIELLERENVKKWLEFGDTSLKHFLK